MSSGKETGAPNLPAVPRGHLVISPEELQATLDVAGRTVLSYVGQLLCAD